MLTLVMHYALIGIAIILTVYTVRHYVFTLNRLVGRQRHPYISIDTADWPAVTVMVAAHNEEMVITHSIEALLNVNYPQDKLEIIIVNDRSTDRTRDIVDDFVGRFPGRIKPFHRTEGKPGKPSALKDATPLSTGEIIIVFDADYIPGRGLIKQLVSPFFDPEVGLVMGRVVPVNTRCNLLTRLLDMERAGGYQVDQQARMNMGLLPQFGGTVGGIRKVMLESVGGWRDDVLAEDTDLTYRALLKGWKTVYQNRSECYEEVPETWRARMRQIMRWAKGHNQSMMRYSLRLLPNRRLGLAQRLDGLLLLGVYAMSPAMLTGWVLAILMFYLGDPYASGAVIALMALVSHGTVGNSAAFFEIGSAIYLDGGRNRIRLLPLNFFSFVLSMMAISRSSFCQILHSLGLNSNAWDKTPRFRSVNFVIG